MKIGGKGEDPPVPDQTASPGGSSNPVTLRAPIPAPWHGQGAGEAATLRSQPDVRRPARGRHVWPNGLWSPWSNL